MLHRALEFIRENLNQYITGLPRINDANIEEVALFNIARLEELMNRPAFNQEVIGISLVNIEEEFSKKNEPLIRRDNNRVRYQSPPAYRNLYVLFAACHDQYPVALQRLSFVINFFESRPRFSFSDMPVAENPMEHFEFTDDERDRFRVQMDPYTLSFEQINHLWGSLGGRQCPFVLYKMRVVELRENQDRTLATGEPILETQTQYNAR
jgi:hypothetical protein